MAMPVKNTSRITEFSDLIAWQVAHNLVLQLYHISRSLPYRERYNVVDQLERAAVSITNNIAEGFGRQSPKEMSQFLYISLGSLKEVQNMLLLCRDLGYIKYDDYQELKRKTIDVNKLLRGLIKANQLRAHQPQSTD